MSNSTANSQRNEAPFSGTPNVGGTERIGVSPWSMFSRRGASLASAVTRPSKARVAFGIAQVSVVPLPWLLPTEWVFGRFLMALLAIVLFIRTWELARGVAPAGAVGWRRLAYLAMLPDIRFSASAQEARTARRDSVKRLLRGLGKVALLAALLWGSSEWPVVDANVVAHVYWLLISAYLATSGICDLLAGLAMAISGHGAAEMFDSPLLATSPRDFWGRRWNLMFRNSAHRLLFTPLGGAQRPVLAVTAVFAWSAVVHEYLVVASLGTTSGQMSAFFGLHCMATLVQGHWARRRGTIRLARPIAVALHLAWFGGTAPLFFDPLMAIVPVHWFTR